MSGAPITTISHYPNAKWWAVGGVVVAIAGAIGSIVWAFWALDVVDTKVQELARFQGAAGSALVVDEPVEWTIYLEPSGRPLSGVRFEIVDLATGEPVPLNGAPNDVAYQVSSESGRPLSQLAVDPGRYEVTVTPGDVTLAIGEDVGREVRQLWWGAALIALPTVLGGGIVAAINAIRHVRAAPAPTAPPPSGEPTGASPQASQPPPPDPGAKRG